MTGPIHPPSSRGNSDFYRVIYDDMLGLIYFIFNVIKKKGSTGEVYLLTTQSPSELADSTVAYPL